MNVKNYLEARKACLEAGGGNLPKLNPAETDFIVYLGYFKCYSNAEQTLEEREINLRGISSIAEFFGLPQSTISINISRLRIKGLVDLLVGKDARTHLVGLTHEGQIFYQNLKSK